MSPNDADGMADSVDLRSSLIWVCTVCPGISVRKLRIITVNLFSAVEFNFDDASLGIVYWVMAQGSLVYIIKRTLLS